MRQNPGRAGRAAAEQAVAAALVWTVVAAGRPPASLRLETRFLLAALAGSAALAAFAAWRVGRSDVGAARSIAAAAFAVSLAVLLASAPGGYLLETLAIALAGACVASAAAYVLISRRIASLALAHLAAEQQGAIENAKREWERTFDAIPALVYLLDADARLVRANRATIAFLSRGFPEAIGRPVAGMGLPSDVQDAPAIRALEAYPGRAFRYQSVPAAQGRAVSIHVLEDVTESEALRQRVVSAERQAALGELVARVAHEVRNPLFGIVASTRVVHDALEDGTDPRPALEHVERETRRLTVLMEELLELRRPATRARVKKPLDALLLQACASARMRHPARALSIEAEIPPGLPQVEVDDVRVAQVVGNLLDNAALSAGGVAIRVRARAEGGAVLVEVEDSGPGLTEEARRRAFEPFFSGRPGGSGLGLRIAKDTMDEHGGSIEISASDMGGARVSLRFPSAEG